MSNCEVFELPVVELEPYQAKEVLRCLLNTILFNRAFGHVKPRDVDSELFDITYVSCGDSDVERDVEAKIGECCLAIERKPAEVTQVCLSFFEKRRKQAGWFGGVQNDGLHWEQWCINMSFGQGDSSFTQQGSQQQTQARAQRQLKLQRAVEGAMMYIVHSVNTKRDHIPPVMSSSVTFPFAITFSGSTHNMYGLSAVKRLLLQTSPPPVLS